MTKIREIMYNNLSEWQNVQMKESPKITCEYKYTEEDFDRIEEELIELFKKKRLTKKDVIGI